MFPGKKFFAAVAMYMPDIKKSVWRRSRLHRRRHEKPDGSSSGLVSSRAFSVDGVAANCQLPIKSSVLITEIMQITALYYIDRICV